MSSASELCLRCGLCCDGTLFTRTPLLPDEAEALRARSAEVTPCARSGTPGLRQPCAALDGSRCTIYADRPASCRRYECLLHGALVEGEVDLDEALTVVEEARARARRGDGDLDAFLDHHFGRRASR